MHFSHPECLHYSRTRTVYFIMGNCVYAFQSLRVSIIHGHRLSPRVSPLFRDSDCLLYNEKLCLCISVTQSVSLIQGLRLSTLYLVILSMYFSHPECLHYSGTRTVYFFVGQGLSALFRHLES